MKSQAAPECQRCTFREFSLFKNCQQGELEDINENKCFHTYKKGQVIFHEGNRPFGLFCVFDGKVKISRLNAEGKEQIIRLAKPGDTLGYRSLIENAKYSASAVALDDTQACFVPASDFNKLVEEQRYAEARVLEPLARGED